MRRVGRLRSVLMVLLSLATVAWAAILLRNALPELRENLAKVRAAWLLIPLAGALVSGYLGFEAFRVLVRQVGQKTYTRLPLANLYFMAQLMKHLPGRIWGIAYQASAGAQIGVATWASVNVISIILASWFAMVGSVSVLAFRAGYGFGVGALVTGVMVYWRLWRPRVLRPLVRQVIRLRWKVIRHVAEALLPFIDATPGLKLRMFGIYAAFFTVYLVSWAGYSLAWPGLALGDGMILCALYTLAWLVGFFTFVTPSGMGVRELAFAAFAHQFPADVIASTAVLGRVMLLIADLFLGSVFCWFPPQRAKVG